MQHRHLNDNVGWSKAAIDSALDRGSLADWRELFADVKKETALAEQVLQVARQHPLSGVLPLVEHMVLLYWPTLSSSGKSS
jgi:hypothetical protein